MNIIIYFFPQRSFASQSNIQDGQYREEALTGWQRGYRQMEFASKKLFQIRAKIKMVNCCFSLPLVITIMIF